MAIWERKKGETQQSFEAFTIYRDMGPKRSLEKVSQKLGKSRSLMERWSRRHNWVERCRAYDEEMDRISREALEEARREMVERHAKTAMMFQQKILERMRNLNPAELSTSDMIKWFDIAVKIERLSRGEPRETEETVKNRVSHFVGALKDVVKDVWDDD